MITVAMGSWMGHVAGLGVVAYSSSLSSPSSTSKGRSSHAFDDGVVIVRDAVRQLPEIAGSGYRCAKEMMRPMMLVMRDSNSLNGRERRERKEAWMHAARM